jgi:tetratricopeptide (TPR) repeat protein
MADLKDTLRQATNHHHQGQLDEAERLFRDALTTRQALLGDEHPDTANSMYAIGLIYSARKDYEEGERWQRKALAIRRKAFGTDEHVDVLNSMNAVATALRHQDRYEEAKEISQQSLEIAERCFGVEHYSSNRYRRALYAALWNLGDAVAIEELNQNYKDRFPEEKQAWGMHALAEAHATNGDVEMAIEVKRRAIKRLPIDSSLREHWQARLEALIELEPGDNKVN